MPPRRPEPAGRAGAPGGVRLVPMRWWHVAQTAALDLLLFDPQAWSAETFWGELAAPARGYVVAVDAEDQVHGYAGIAVNGADADVQTIAVAPRAQGTGLGHRLLVALVEAAAAHGAGSLLLEVRADNHPAIGLYRRHGFEQIAVRRRYYQPGGIDALIMRRRPLSPPPPS